MTTERAEVEARSEAAAKRLAIVVADIAGSAALIAQAGDLQFMGALDEFFQRVRVLQTGHCGHIVKSLGDGFLAVFDEVEDALAFSTALQRSLGEDPIRVGGQPLTLRVGLHAGEVYPLLTSYGEDVFGSAVTVAARLTAVAKPGQIIISEPARLALPEEQRTRLGPSERLFDFKGFSGPVEINRLDLVGA